MLELANVKDSQSLAADSFEQLLNNRPHTMPKTVAGWMHV